MDYECEQRQLRNLASRTVWKRPSITGNLAKNLMSNAGAAISPTHFVVDWW
jgi:hypothetical protein